MYTMMTTTDFNAKLAKAGHSQLETNKLFDEVLWDAFHQAMPVDSGGHGSTARLSAIIGMAEHTRGINVRKMQAYIQAHADLKWVKADNGTHNFKFKDKPAVTLPSVPWYEYEHPTDKAKVDVDIVKEIRRLLNKAAKEDAVIKDDKGALPQLRALAAEFGITWQHTASKPAVGKASKHRTPV